MARRALPGLGKEPVVFGREAERASVSPSRSQGVGEVVQGTALSPDFVLGQNNWECLEGLGMVL